VKYCVARSDPLSSPNTMVELSLSVDDLFVFVIIIGSFAVPVAQQPKTLTIGIVLALGLRAVFIALALRCFGRSRSCS